MFAPTTFRIPISFNLKSALAIEILIKLKLGTANISKATIIRIIINKEFGLESENLDLISAGFDAHRRDPLAGINLEREDYAYMAGQCLKIQSNILLGLEGGYDLRALGECSVSVVNELV